MKVLPPKVIVQRRLLTAGKIRIQVELIFGTIRARLFGQCGELLGAGYALTPSAAIDNAIGSKLWESST